MRRSGAVVVLLASLVFIGAGGARSRAEVVRSDPRVLSLRLDGVVDPFIASYVKAGIAAAEKSGANAVLLTIDTPGGLDSSMRKITKAILGSSAPVICYTAPSGARAASAGTFIMLACPVNAMAPGTNIGAAHPVGVSGAIEQSKVTNDAAAYIRSLAERWGRNADWAEQAVRKSVSVSAEEALRLHVVDQIAPSASALLREVDGRVIRIAGGRQVTLRTAGASLEVRKLGLGAAFLHTLIDPNLAFLFFSLGLVFIVVELLHPGLSVPGVLGVLMLVTAFVSLGFLPFQLGGVILLIAAAVFFLLELKHPGLGLPTVAGMASLILGGLLLFNPSVPNARVSPWLIAVLAAALGLFFGFVVRAALKARRVPLAAGMEGMAGEEGVAIDDLDPTGRVRARRENWTAESVGPRIAAGTAVRVIRVEGLRLMVEPASHAPERHQDELTGHQPAGREGGG